jgi:hypothetical protein
MERPGDALGTVPLLVPPYEPQTLSRLPSGRFTQLVEAAKRRRLVLYLGAGISVAELSCGPKGSEVADFLRPGVAQMLDIAEDELATLSLEDLAQRVADEDGDRLDALRVRASEAADFVDLTPNFGHEAAVLLLREGMIRLISVNWDCGVELAGLRASVGIRGIANATENGDIADGLLLLKVHGCATRPRTLAITQSEVDDPQPWAVGRVQGALADGIVVFVGLGTVGLYVREPIEKLVEVWGKDAASVLIADPVLSAAWEEALGSEAAAQAHIQCAADAFLDDLLRAVVLEALETTGQQIRALPQGERWVGDMQRGFEELRAAFGNAKVDSVSRWWRDGVTSASNGTPFITEQGGIWSVMSIGLLAGQDGGPIEVVGAHGRQTVASPSRYFEIVCKPGKPISEVERVGRHRILERISDGVYRDKRPISVVVPGAIGKFPSNSAPIDISAGTADLTDIAEGTESAPIRFFSAEDGVHGRLAA